MRRPPNPSATYRCTRIDRGLVVSALRLRLVLAMSTTQRVYWTRAAGNATEVTSLTELLRTLSKPCRLHIPPARATVAPASAYGRSADCYRTTTTATTTTTDHETDRQKTTAANLYAVDPDGGSGSYH